MLHLKILFFKSKRKKYIKKPRKRNIINTTILGLPQSNQKTFFSAPFPTLLQHRTDCFFQYFPFTLVPYTLHWSLTLTYTSTNCHFNQTDIQSIVLTPASSQLKISINLSYNYAYERNSNLGYFNYTNKTNLEINHVNFTVRVSNPQQIMDNVFLN